MDMPLRVQERGEVIDGREAVVQKEEEEIMDEKMIADWEIDDDEVVFLDTEGMELGRVNIEVLVSMYLERCDG